jgi:hypothetical protein
MFSTGLVGRPDRIVCTTRQVARQSWRIHRILHQWAAISPRVPNEYSLSESDALRLAYSRRSDSLTQYSSTRSTHNDSTTCAEMLLSSTGSAEGQTPLPPNLPELVLRPISQPPDPDLQGRVWRLVSMVSPKGKAPAHRTCAKVVRLIRETISGTQPPDGPTQTRVLPDRELMFIRPVQRLAKIDGNGVPAILDS